MYFPALPLVPRNSFSFTFQFNYSYCLCVCRGQERVWDPWGWNCRHLWAAQCGPGTGSSGQSRKPFNCSTISAALTLPSARRKRSRLCLPFSRKDVNGWVGGRGSLHHLARIESDQLSLASHVVVFSHLRFQRVTKKSLSPAPHCSKQ